MYILSLSRGRGGAPRGKSGILRAQAGAGGRGRGRGMSSDRGGGRGDRGGRGGDRLESSKYFKYPIFLCWDDMSLFCHLSRGGYGGRGGDRGGRGGGW